MPQENSSIIAARARGGEYKLKELASPENLPVESAAVRSGLSVEAISEMQRDGLLYALSHDDGTYTLCYPAWQFDVLPGRLGPVLNALSKAGIKSWGVHSFMSTPSSDLGDLTPREWILRSNKSLDTVLVCVQRRFADDQGAQ